MVHIIVFDSGGAHRRRIDDQWLRTQLVKAPFYNTFKMLLAERPGCFQWYRELTDLPPIEVNWECIFSTAGVAHVRLGDAPAAVSIFLRGASLASEDAVLDGLSESLASTSGTTLYSAFTAFKQCEQRPLVATIYFSAIDADTKLKFVRGVHQSLAAAFFASATVESAADQSAPRQIA